MRDLLVPTGDHEDAAEKIYADNEFIPLSYLGITDPQQMIVFREHALKACDFKNCWIEQFQNPYYELCKEKLASVDRKKETRGGRESGEAEAARENAYAFARLLHEQDREEK